MDRRELLVAGLGATVFTGVSTLRANDSSRPSLKAVHVTDCHVTDTRDAAAGVAAMVAHAKSRPNWQPDLVLNTGDSVMGVDGKVTGTRAKVQIDLWKRSTAGFGQVPVRSCLGNHDVWDGLEPTADIPAAKARFALMTEVLGMPAPYYSFDQGGWHFISLNSVDAWPEYGVLPAEQFQWLRDDLKKTPKSTPVCVLSHLPIVSVTSSLYGNGQRKKDGVLIPKVWQHVDCWEISEVFRAHPDVKLCLSGHMHTQDRCEYRGVWYVCGGAVSGAWWDGSEYGFPPCYGAIDFYESGEFAYQFVDYNWKARAWRGKQLGI